MIGFDWNGAASEFDYNIAKLRTLDVGIYLSDYLIFLNENCRINYNDITLVGHSLGAHAAGIGMKYEKKIINCY